MAKSIHSLKNIALLVITICGYIFIFCQSPSAETFLPAPSDADAYEIIEQVLEVNRPWLEPNPIRASYRLVKDSKVSIGAYEVNGDSAAMYRLGVILNTPLHTINKAFKLPSPDESVALSVVGLTDNQRTIVIEAKFLTSEENSIGFFKNESEMYSHSNYPLYNCRIYLDVESYAPNQIITTSEAGFVEPFFVYETWSFNNRFYETEIGLLPHSINWSTYETVVDYIFQYTDGAWIFLEGASWYSDTNPSGLTGVIDFFQMFDLVVANPNLNEVSSAKHWFLY